MVRIEHGGIYGNNQSKLCVEDKNDTRNILKKMMKIVSLLSVVTIVLMSFIQEALFSSEDGSKIDSKSDKVTSEITFSHHAVLDKHGKYHLFWLPEQNVITFEVQVTIFSLYYYQNLKCINYRCD